MRFKSLYFHRIVMSKEKHNDDSLKNIMEAENAGDILAGYYPKGVATMRLTYGALLGLDGWREEAFVGKYTEQAHIFLSSRRESIPKPTTYSDKKKCVQDAIVKGFCPIEIGLNLIRADKDWTDRLGDDAQKYTFFTPIGETEQNYYTGLLDQPAKQISSMGLELSSIQSLQLQKRIEEILSIADNPPEKPDGYPDWMIVANSASSRYYDTLEIFSSLKEDHPLRKMYTVERIENALDQIDSYCEF